MSFLISIVTVVFNGKADLETTIKSIKSQSYQGYEYIVVDGLSTDGTIDVIKSHSDLVSKFVSEKDKGLYDAMNKGVEMASGKYVIFMNAGDEFYETGTLEKVVPALKSSTSEDFIYGSSVVLFAGKQWERSPLPLNEMWKMMPFSHQSVFIRSEYHKKVSYDLTFKIGADFNFLYSSYKENRTFKKLDLIVSNVSPGGLSDKKRVESIRERLRSLSKYPVTAAMKLYYSYLISDARARLFLKGILPAELVKKLILAKYKT